MVLKLCKTPHQGTFFFENCRHTGHSLWTASKLKLTPKPSRSRVGKWVQTLPYSFLRLQAPSRLIHQLFLWTFDTDKFSGFRPVFFLVCVKFPPVQNDVLLEICHLKKFVFMTFLLNWLVLIYQGQHVAEKGFWKSPASHSVQPTWMKRKSGWWHKVVQNFTEKTFIGRTVLQNSTKELDENTFAVVNFVIACWESKEV